MTNLFEYSTLSNLLPDHESVKTKRVPMYILYSVERLIFITSAQQQQGLRDVTTVCFTAISKP